MADPLAGLDFTGSLRDAQKGLLVKPIVHNYLFDARFPDFAIHFKNHEMERAPDAWFHPSTHPLWTPRQLYFYLAQPHLMVAEKKQYMGTLSVTIGTAMHGFMEVCMEDAGIRPRELNRCTTCPPEMKCKEPGVVDAEAGSRGHMDGLLDLSMLSLPSEAHESPVFEFKTSNEAKMAKVPDLDLETYRAKWPEYYAQNQEYMRMSGRRLTIVLFMALGYPWPMTEIHVPYDQGFAQTIRNKYLDVRQAVADQQIPFSCCGNTKVCPSGRICATLEPTPAASRRLAL
jgi:hypothetical protein